MWYLGSSVHNTMIKETMKNWKYELFFSYVMLFLIFEIFFYKEGLKPFVMAFIVLIFIQIPGILFASYIFKDRFKRYELSIIGFGFGMVITPLSIYFINIFEVLHVKYLGFIVPLLLIILLGFLNSKE